ncbi:MAG TPA: hypothetical protein VHY09_00315 [Candidatus Methylacidiphilales bacterium]|jgi:hypothetical protein|nr:hypothetical protein [Candidatus Methylacidiphilales bacterium]
MNLAEFQLSQKQPAPSSGWPDALQALWFDARGDWDKAHELAQKDGGASGNWVHAYLHRKEGDTSNARYWYNQAGKPVYTGSLEDEWAAITEALLAKNEM